MQGGYRAAADNATMQFRSLHNPKPIANANQLRVLYEYQVPDITVILYWTTMTSHVHDFVRTRWVAKIPALC